MNFRSFLSLVLLSLIIISCNTNATLEIKSNVQNAEVFVNDKSVGGAPLTISVESGETAIVLKKAGYTDYKTKLTLESGDKKVLTANMKAVASVTLEIDANVDDAEVYLNDKSLGKTPLTRKLRPGSANISVRKAGYTTYNERISVSANTTKTIEAELLTDVEAMMAKDEADYRTNDSGTFIDVRDGQQYKWLKIGNKIWMAENLNYVVSDRSWCYDKDSINCERLYSQRGAKEAADLRGWRVPSDKEWQELFNTFGEDAYSSLIDGGSVGFDAELDGIYNYFAQYSGKNELGYYWSSTRDDSCNICGFSWIFDSKSETIYRNPESFISMGFSVRLVRDVSN